MNIRRVVAKDMRSALRAVREQVGPDAVMLSSRQGDDGVEVIAAVDFDERLLAQSRATVASSDPPPDEQQEPAAPADPDEAVESTAAPTSGGPLNFGDYHEIARQLQDAPATPASTKNEQADTRVSAELKDLRQLLETQLASLAWNDLNRRKPDRARVLRQFAKLGIDTELARELAEVLPSTGAERDDWRLPFRLLAQRIPVAKRELADAGKVFAVVGPTGVGKTTSIAKIAARFVLRGRAQNLGIVSTDSFRVGAREQLLTFARILGVPLNVAASADDLRDVLDSLAQKKLVLIDTAGMSQRDVRLAQQFSTLRLTGHRVYPVLAVSAATDRQTLFEIYEAFKAVGPKALIVTKIDEAASLGPVLSLAIRSGLPIAYLSDGQRVPEDLHLAGPKRTWLMQTAMTLARTHGTADEDDLADRFGSLELAVNA